MKMITRIILLLSLCGAGATGEKRASSETCALRGIQEPLSAQDIQSALDVLGLSLERFACTVPEETRLRVSVRQYLHGAADKVLSERTLSLHPGEQKLTLFMREANDGLTFTFQVAGNRVGLGSVGLEGYPARTWGRVNGGPLEKGRAVPFHLFAANLNRITSFSPDRPLEELTGQYALAVVFLAELL